MDSFKKLKIWRAEVKWEIEDERTEFHGQLVRLIRDWKGQLPDFREIFQPEEMDWLLTRSIDSMGWNDVIAPPFIKFLINSGYKDQPKVDQDGKTSILRTTPIHRVFIYHRHKWAVVRELFKIYDRLDVNYIDEESGLTHFHVACRLDFDDIVQKFLELGQDPNLVGHERGWPPLHSAVTHDSKKVVELLLRNGANPNLADLCGWTPLHCIYFGKKDQSNNDSLVELFFKINDENHQIVQVDAQDNDGNTPLHLAIKCGKKKTIEFLLRRGGDPNLANKNGETLLHIILRHSDDTYDWMEMLFKICDEKHQTLQLNARNKWGDTPLHFAVSHNDGRAIEVLLRRGSDPNSTNEEGVTPLHSICSKIHGIHGIHGRNNFAKLFFNVNDDLQQTVQVNARDNYGTTPLHRAMDMDEDAKEMVELLLTRGADPNVADATGSTPLHIICQRERRWQNELLKKFLEMCDEKNLTLQLDARDKFNLTPLQWAVGKLLLNIVNVLLDRGADLSSFVFPSESHFYLSYKTSIMCFKIKTNFKLRMTSDVLAIVDHLEKRGYELKQSDAMIIINTFAKIEVLEKTSDLEKSWYDDEKFVETSKKILMKENDPGLSLYDLIQLRPKEAAKRLTRQDWFEFAHANKLWKLTERSREACISQIVRDYNYNDMDSLKKLKILRAEVKWEIEDERTEFHRQLVRLIRDWKGRFPDFREIFQPEEIDWLLLQAIESETSHYDRDPFIEFLIKIGYKDQLKVDQDGKTSFLRTTPVHRMVNYRIHQWALLVVRKLFKIYNRFDVNYIDEETGLSHFHVACRFDFDDIVQKFLELGQDSNLVVQGIGLPPLHSAVTHDSKNVVELLLRNGANPNLTDLYGRTPLHVICSRSASQFDDDSLLQLFFKINDENHQIVQVDAQDNDGNTPLRMAVNRGKKKTIEFLMTRGADVNLVDNNVDWEIGVERIKFLRQLGRLIEDWKGQLPDLRDIFQPQEIDWLLIQSIKSNDNIFGLAPFFQFLIDAGYKDEPTVDQDGKPLLLRTTAVHREASYRIFSWATPVVRKLFKIYDRFDVNYIDEETGLTHFHVACRFDFDDIVQKFLELEQDPDFVVQERGLPPLHSAVTHNSKKVVELLLRNGANPNLADIHGRAPLHVICSRSRRPFDDVDDNSLLELFFKINDEKNQTVQVDAQDGKGHTPLYMAMNYGTKEKVEFLLRRGADPKLANSDENTQLEYFSGRRPWNLS
ncbi:unnamed protein product [Trichogramma brassicae]|uniref:Uncharacterized protein n=1 Tax=Trichogramma brassicae TaxID=86971 RepID=A0A6H5IQN1_9HYME|nr:unnamed protein product [Trichogramma brassicae]